MIAPRRKLVRRPFLTDESKPTPRRTKRREPMTVCVAAVCNIRPGEPPFVVGASDRMITILDAEFEPRQTKQLRLASHTMGLFSGDMQVHAVVCPATMRNLSRLGLTHPQVKDIAEAYAEEFARYRRNQAERLYLTPVNLTVDTFITAGHTLDPNLASDLYRKWRST
jgi:hypothetical protein